MVQWPCMCVCLFVGLCESWNQHVKWPTFKSKVLTFVLFKCECLLGQLTMLCECGEHHSHTVFSELWAKECCVSQQKAVERFLLLQCWNSVAASAMHSRLSRKNDCCLMFYTCAYSGMPRILCVSLVLGKWSRSKYSSLIPRPPPAPLPEREYVNTGRAWYLFSHEHDVIKIRPEFLEQKGNILHVLLINFAFIAQCMDTCSKLPTTFAVFFFNLVRSFWIRLYTFLYSWNY